MKISNKIGLSVLLIGSMIFLGCTSSEQSMNTEPALVPFTLVEVDRYGPQDVWAKAYGDLNGNGLYDLIAGGNASDGGGLVWYENPEWTRHDIDSEARIGTDVEIADMNGNGLLDVVAIVYGEEQMIAWYENPNWTRHVVAPETRVHDLQVADFDGDGNKEIIARNQGEFGQSGADLFLYKQESPNSWVGSSFSIPEGEGIQRADMNDNDRLDIVVNKNWYENTGDFRIWREHVYTEEWTHNNAYIDVGDLSGNGRMDIVLSPAELAGQYYKLSWFEAPADPTTGPWTEHIVEDNIEAVLHFVGLADFNSNGRLDIATAEMEQGEWPDEVKIYLNSEEGINSWRKQVLYTGGSHSMKIMDINNNGAPDLFGANWRGKEVWLWVNLKQ